MLEKIHDLRKLGGELAARDPALGEQVRPLVVALAEVYFTARYPGFDFDDPDWFTMRTQLAAVATVLEAVKTRVGST